ncbi:ComF family protein [Thalassomonas actiniarum]|uniref:ComF family protein n=1 Tax=Thalassomonas actiniarum TaxID=485447 RepID=A0AAE9YPK7_9GAMM|nr:ComF family protein [Thalassomonas actiniarum]WDD98914.1 ComF family protein [Thalassomonas actiniarum]
MELKPPLLKSGRQLLAISQSCYLRSLIYFKSLLTTRLSSCDLCGSPCRQYALLCHTCAGDLPVFKTAGIRGDLLNWPAVNRALPKTCFDHLVSLSPYQWPLSMWLKQLKYQGRFELATLLGQVLADHWQKQIKPYLEEAPGLVLPVPLHFSKWQLRGYNQAHLIAKTFAGQLDYRYQATALTRVKQTSAQVGQSGIARRKNLRRAFTVNTKLLPQHVLLIDDVITTGSTVNEISRQLKKQGVLKVTVVSACLTLPG